MTGAMGRAPVEIGVKRWRLNKYVGDPPKPGEDKEPFEIIEGGDGLPTRVVHRRVGAAPPESYASLPTDFEENDHADDSA